MSLTVEQRSVIKELVSNSLDSAEHVWEKHQPIFETATATLKFDSMAKRAEIAPSRIPDHPFVSSEHSKISEYVCFVADMRESSKHLMNAYSHSRPTYELMKRVYFETAALLPALDQTIQFEQGSVTEYLGDGVLALFSIDPDDRGSGIGKAYRAAQNCVSDTRMIVNEEIKSRYWLPPLDLGVGLGFGNAIVQLIGVPSRMHPKVLGPCVYYATKLSTGKNIMLVNEALKKAWPTSKDGKLQFTLTPVRGGISGYSVA